jgi:hypothetical protein
MGRGLHVQSMPLGDNLGEFLEGAPPSDNGIFRHWAIHLQDL